MRDQLIQYVSLLFAGAEDCEDTKQEILQNTGNQQFPAATGILHVNHLLLPVYFHAGDKAVWTAPEYPGFHIGIMHSHSTLPRARIAEICRKSRGFFSNSVLTFREFVV